MSVRDQVLIELRAALRADVRIDHHSNGWVSGWYILDALDRKQSDTEIPVVLSELANEGKVYRRNVGRRTTEWRVAT